MEPSAPIIIWTMVVLSGHIFWISIFRSVYLSNFLVGFWAIQLCPGIAMSIKKQCSCKRSTQTMYGRLWTWCRSVWMVKSHKRFKLLLCIAGTGVHCRYWMMVPPIGINVKIPILASSQWMIRATTSRQVL